MRRSLLLLAVVLTLVACGTRQPATTHKGRIIRITDAMLGMGGTDTVRFGHLRPGEIAVLHFHFENASTHPTAVVSYRRTCGCTTLEFDPQPLAPGNSRQASLIFDSRGESGWQLKLLDITLAGAAQPLRLYIEAEIE